jgi:hypothetical protein
MDSAQREVIRQMRDSAARERIGHRLHSLTERDARQRRQLREIQGWNDAAPFLRSAPDGGHYSADVWNQRGRERVTCHGVATIPGYFPTPAQMEDVANGLVTDTVRVRRRGQFASEIHTVASYREERDSRRRQPATAATAATPDTARQEVQPQLRHDFN